MKMEVVKDEEKKYLQLHWTEISDQLNVQEPLKGYKVCIYFSVVE